MSRLPLIRSRKSSGSPYTASWCSALSAKLPPYHSLYSSSLSSRKSAPKSMNALPAFTHWAASSWDSPWGSAAKITSLFSSTCSWVPHIMSHIWKYAGYTSERVLPSKLTELIADSSAWGWPIISRQSSTPA